ncbi:MAG: pyrroline-5-carboxylate reductase [Rhodospirillales bacterium]
MQNPSGRKVLLSGCGKMGGALLKGWLAEGLSASDITVVDPNPAGPIPGAGPGGVTGGVTAVRDVADLPQDFTPETAVLAVKPQMMDDVLPGHRRFAEAGSLIISIAAGPRISYYENALGADARIVRAMPNTPAAIGLGITALAANAHVDEAGFARAETLMRAVGETVRLDDENLMDAVTAVSGTGPAYVFLLAEHLAAAGEKAGLPADLSLLLARATVAGAGALLGAEAETPPATLRENVTSPGGTTAAAMEVLMGESDWRAALDKAVQAAKARSRELAG